MNSLVLGIVVVIAAPAPKEVKKDPPTIIGEWSLESAVLGGMAMPAKMGPVTLAFTAEGKCIATEGAARMPETLSFTHDAKKNPAQLDLVEGRNMKDMRMQGIYKIEGDTLTLCISMEGARPEKFESAEKAPTILFTLKRIKKD